MSIEEVMMMPITKGFIAILTIGFAYQSYKIFKPFVEDMFNTKKDLLSKINKELRHSKTGRFYSNKGNSIAYKRLFLAVNGNYKLNAEEMDPFNILLLNDIHVAYSDSVPYDEIDTEKENERFFILINSKTKYKTSLLQKAIAVLYLNNIADIDNTFIRRSKLKNKKIFNSIDVQDFTLDIFLNNRKFIKFIDSKISTLKLSEICEKFNMSPDLMKRRLDIMEIEYKDDM